MVVKSLKQHSNIPNTYEKQVFESIKNRSFHFYVKIKSSFSNFEEHRTNRCLTIFGIIRFWDLGIFHIFHCLGSHARGHFKNLQEFRLMFSTPVPRPASWERRIATQVHTASTTNPNAPSDAHTAIPACYCSLPDVAAEFILRTATFLRGRIHHRMAYSVAEGQCAKRRAYPPH